MKLEIPKCPGGLVLYCFLDLLIMLIWISSVVLSLHRKRNSILEVQFIVGFSGSRILKNMSFDSPRLSWTLKLESRCNWSWRSYRSDAAFISMLYFRHMNLFPLKPSLFSWLIVAAHFLCDKATCTKILHSCSSSSLGVLIFYTNRACMCASSFTGMLICAHSLWLVCSSSLPSVLIFFIWCVSWSSLTGVLIIFDWYPLHLWLVCSSSLTGILFTFDWCAHHHLWLVCSSSLTGVLIIFDWCAYSLHLAFSDSLLFPSSAFTVFPCFSCLSPNSGLQSLYTYLKRISCKKQAISSSNNILWMSSDCGFKIKILAEQFWQRDCSLQSFVHVSQIWKSASQPHSIV